MSDELDAAVIQAQIGRPPRGPSRAASRCHLGLPVVVVVPPVLDDGTPFPTYYWLTCPLAHRRIARLEAAGEVGAWEQRLRDDEELAVAMKRAHEAYAAERDSHVPEGALLRPKGGVAGLDPAGGLKCLHTHYAHERAGGENPVGEGVAREIEPLDCTHACVTIDAEGARRSPEWREPR